MKILPGATHHGDKSYRPSCGGGNRSLWFTADLHLNHDREFIYRPRGFVSVAEMNSAILHNWNTNVAPDDDVYILGDVFLGDNEAGLQLLKQLSQQPPSIRL